MPDQEADQDPVDGAANSIRFEVHGRPPLQGEAISACNPKHGQADRIRALLQAAQRACQEHGFAPIDKGSVALDMITRSPAGDAANIVGASRTSWRISPFGLTAPRSTIWVISRQSGFTATTSRSSRSRTAKSRASVVTRLPFVRSEVAG